MKNKLVIAAVCGAVFALVSQASEGIGLARNRNQSQTQYATAGLMTSATVPNITLKQIQAKTTPVIAAFNQAKGLIQKNKKANVAITPETMGCLAALTGAFTLTDKGFIQKGTQSQYIAVGGVLSKKYYKINLSETDLAQFGAQVGILFGAATKPTAYRTAKTSTAWQ